MTFYYQLQQTCHSWHDYTRHPFVLALAKGTLLEKLFRQYLTQDYLFLLHFARAYALAIYKSNSLAQMQYGLSGLKAILEEEIALHVSYCQNWGLSQQEMERTEEAAPTMAYTRFVLDTGLRSNLLALITALAPCVVGYFEIATWLQQQPFTIKQDNPYASWIEMYAGDDYGKVAKGAIAFLDELAQNYGGEARIAELQQIFTTATNMEAAFWPCLS